jgi:two-component system KDP operon response regulator KdpE
MTNNKYKILLVEDDGNIQSLVSTLLENQDYQVLLAQNCAEGQLLYSSHRPDLVILDLGLPDGDGLGLLKAVREQDTTPFIVLSARDLEADKVQALDMGANDYVTKPFGSAELMARVRSALRTSRHSATQGKLPGGRFLLGDLVIDYDARRLFIAGSEIKLTQTEYNILALLSEHAGKVLTYTTIIKTIWGLPDDGSVKKLQVNMANIRKKMGARPGEHNYISNELGVGYRMNID